MVDDDVARARPVRWGRKRTTSNAKGVLVRSGLTRDRVTCHTHNARPKTETRVHKAVLVYVEAMVETSISDFAGDDACSALERSIRSSNAPGPH